jgi:hypothetical protein
MILAALMFNMADKDEPKYHFTLKKADDTVEVRKEEKRTVFVVTSKSGIGDMKALLTEGSWPRDVVLRFVYDKARGFTMLESFGLQTSRISVDGSLRTSGAMELYFLSPEGKAEGAAGKVNVKVEARAGALEVTLPAHLLTGTKEVRFSWIDAFRQ